MNQACMNQACMDEAANFDVLVVGGGPVGLASGIALAERGVNTALVAPRLPYADNRTTALLGDSVAFMEQFGVWSRCAGKAEALRVMRLVDDTGRLIRAPEVRFECSEIGLDVFGYNIANADLSSALEQRSDEISSLTRIDDQAEAVDTEDASPGGAVTIRLRRGDNVRARLVVAADGKNSLCRTAAGIAFTHRDLHQTALTFNIGLSRPHQNVSTEFHTPQGPCVFVPLPGNRASVVWVTSSSEAERLRVLDDGALAEMAEHRCHSIFGRISIDPGRHLFPLVIEQPRQFATRRVALVGEAAHVLPPIGAQGLNMGFRDAMDIARIAGDAVAAGEDPGGAQALARYDRARRGDVTSRTWTIDLANRSLLSDWLPAQSARAAGLHLLQSVGPLRRLAMREGLAPSWRRRQAI